MRHSTAFLITVVLFSGGVMGCHPSKTPPMAIASTRSLRMQTDHLTIRSSSLVKFINVALSSGLHYRWSASGPHPLTILRTMGYGCAFLDYNNDGNLDILLIGPRLALYKGDGHGHFTDVTHFMGLDKVKGQFMGCCVGDYDNDGYDDIYISGYHTGILLHNQHGQSFKDVTQEIGLTPQPWGTSCTFADFNSTGYLDLYVCNYVQFDSTSPQFCPEQNSIQAACNPNYYKSLQGVFFHNLKGRRFQNVTDAWAGHQQTGNGLGVTCADFAGTGHIGLAIADDGLNDDLLENQGQGHLQNINLRSGTARGANGGTHAGMGIDWGDYDNDGRLDLFVTTFSHEAKSLYHNEGNGLFTEPSDDAGISDVLVHEISFGTKFFDADNDGWLDLIVASGHVEDNIKRIDNTESYRQPLKLLHNCGHTPVAFARITDSAWLSKLPPIVGRGLAVGDFDNDGRMDALVVDAAGEPLLLHNETPRQNRWIGFCLHGTGMSNRDAYGAVVTVTLADGQTRIRYCHADGSYLSSSDSRVHFGLGRSSVTNVVVRWPDGKKDSWGALPSNHYKTLIEH